MASVEKEVGLTPVAARLPSAGRRVAVSPTPMPPHQEEEGAAAMRNNSLKEEAREVVDGVDPNASPRQDG